MCILQKCIIYVGASTTVKILYTAVQLLFSAVLGWWFNDAGSNPEGKLARVGGKGLYDMEDNASTKNERMNCRIGKKHLLICTEGLKTSFRDKQGYLRAFIL